MSVSPSFVTIDLSRDSLFDDFALQTLKERYLLPSESSPQEAFARAAAAFADDAAHAQRLYDYVSRGWFMFATPLLSNGGTERGLPISCFLNFVEDSRESILDHYAECGWLASVGGGIGAYWGQLREDGHPTSKGSASTGTIPFIKVADSEIMAFSQGTTRRGSYAAYMDISHPEIEEFITVRKPTGGDQNRKSTNIHNAVNLTDEFMEAVAADGLFDLRSPKSGAEVKTVRARDLWRLLIETRMQTGEPYMVFIDTINRALPEAQKKLGLKVYQSNLCTPGYTNILTRNGNVPIGDLEGLSVEIWNGLAWSRATIQKTAGYEDRPELVRVCLSDGWRVDCTTEHKFHLADGSVQAAVELRDGDKLTPSTHPLIVHDHALGPNHDSAVAHAYTAGFATIAGFEDKHKLAIHVPPNLIDDEKIRLLTVMSCDLQEDESGIRIRYEHGTVNTGHIGFHWSIPEFRAWLKGAIDAANESFSVEEVDRCVIGTFDLELVKDMRLKALECGLTPVVRYTTTTHVFSITKAEYDSLLNPAEETMTDVYVTQVHPLPFHMDTYCTTEPVRGIISLNGYLTGNCTEITLPTGRDSFNKMRTAVCCLSSVNAEKFDQWRSDAFFVEDLMRMLDNALTMFIDDGTPGLDYARYSAMRERSVGLGVLGFQSYLQSKGLPMDAPDTSTINSIIFGHLQDATHRASRKLAIERGEAPDMRGTGERFAHRMAVAPNASSSILCGGVSPSIEPQRANAFLHKTLSGSFPVRNKYLVETLNEFGFNTDSTWQSIVANEGSIQQLDLPDYVKSIFKTATEIDQMVLVRLAAERAPLICQAQSLNLFFEHDTPAASITEAHFMAWKLGVKSLYYLRSTTPRRAENTNTKVERVITVSTSVTEDEGCIACEG